MCGSGPFFRLKKRKNMNDRRGCLEYAPRLAAIACQCPVWTAQHMCWHYLGCLATRHPETAGLGTSQPRQQHVHEFVSHVPPHVVHCCPVLGGCGLASPPPAWRQLNGALSLARRAPIATCTCTFKVMKQTLQKIQHCVCALVHACMDGLPVMTAAAPTHARTVSQS